MKTDVDPATVGLWLTTVVIVFVACVFSAITGAGFAVSTIVGIVAGSVLLAILSIVAHRQQAKAVAEAQRQLERLEKLAADIRKQDTPDEDGKPPEIAGGAAWGAPGQ